jgi:hypothetical protein
VTAAFIIRTSSNYKRLKNRSVLHLGILKVLEVLREYATSVFGSGRSGCNLWFLSSIISLKSLSHAIWRLSSRVRSLEWEILKVQTGECILHKHNCINKANVPYWLVSYIPIWNLNVSPGLGLDLNKILNKRKCRIKIMGGKFQERCLYKKSVSFSIRKMFVSERCQVSLLRYLY